MIKKVLFCIDPQYDFLEGGNLGVDGATNKMDGLVKYIDEHHQEYDSIIFTVDFHPQSHCSFKENGGIWPSHCVQHSQGAAIYQPILDVLNKNKVDYTVLTKGCDEDHEEYSIFKNEDSCKRIIAMMESLGISEAHVGGLVFEFCVAETLKDGLRYLPNVKFKVFNDFCPILDKERADDFVKFTEECERIELI